MFYLITQDLGIHGESMLINTISLKSIEVSTGDKYFDLIVTHYNDINKFSFKPENLINVDNIISDITQLKTCSYINNFIALTDIENRDTINKQYGTQSILHNKASTLLINIEDISIVSESKKHYCLHTHNQKFIIKESPKEVFDIISQKIIVPQQMVSQQQSVLNKLELKHKL